MASPFYRIETESGIDITDLVDSIDFDDSSEKDNMMSIPLKGISKDEFSKEDYQKGKEITFYFGYLSGKRSRTRRVVIDSRSFSYVGENSVTLKCRDHGSLLKKNTSSKVFKEKTISQIVKLIADDYGFDSEIDETQKVYDSLSVGNKDYYSFLCDLALKASTDTKAIQFKLVDNKIFFTSRDISKEPIKTFTYQSDGFVSFKIDEKSDDDSSGVSVTSSNIDDSTGETISSSSEDSGNEVSTGKYKMSYDVDGKGKKIVDKAVEVGKKIIVSGNDKSELKSAVSKTNKDAELDSENGTMEVPGDPYLEPDEIITLSNLSDIHSGNWRIKSVRHTIQGGGYLSVITVSRNGSKVESGNSRVNTTVNDNIGPDDTDQSKELKTHVYNVNGVEQ